jgi:hypothetical protein
METKWFSWSPCGGTCPHGEHGSLESAQSCAKWMNGTGAPVPYYVFRQDPGQTWVLAH